MTFFFDPLCPWTWRTARWLMIVAYAKQLDVEWRSFSLELLHVDEDEAVPARLEMSTVALRLVEALAAAGRHHDAGSFYAALGRRVHDEHLELDLHTVCAAAHEAGVDDAVEALEEPQWDAVILESYARAMDAAGPDIGSPVVVLPGSVRGLHGPILAAIPECDDAIAIWDAMTVLLRAPTFFEIKRGRPESSAAA